MLKRRAFIAGGSAVGVLGVMGQAFAHGGTDFYVPAEEAKHQRTFMQWPVNLHMHSDPVFLTMVQQAVADIAHAVSAFEPVTMLVAQADQATARRKLSRAVELWDIPTEDLWCRDAGPIFVVNRAGELAVSHVQFNGWGGKQLHRRDGQIAGLVAERLGLKLLPSGLRGEAGAVEQDGHGVMMAHESSWVNKNRNPGLSRDEIESRLLTAYGATRMIWSPGVKGEDITDYHIDSLARFTGPGRVLLNLPNTLDMRDPFHVAAVNTRDKLVAEGLDVDVIYEPSKPRVCHRDFVASYANHYVCNGGVIAAQFGDPAADHAAKQAIARHYPEREIVMLNVDPLGEIGGGIHCATQQMPAT